MMRLLSFVAISAAFLPPQGKDRIPNSSVVMTSVCELSNKPIAFDGKMVRFHAQFESDGIERSVLIDSECPQGAVLPYMADHASGNKSLDEAIATGHPGTLDKSITATFTGLFHYSAKPEMCTFISKELCRRSIEITQVSNLILTMKQIDQKTKQ